MLASYPPFYDEDPMKTYAKIMQGTINFPSHFSKEAVSLIKKLLQHKPTKRLGVVNGGAGGCMVAHSRQAKQLQAEAKGCYSCSARGNQTCSYRCMHDQFTVTNNGAPARGRW